MIASFLALVWLDSAAFLIIQETAAWKQHTWGSAQRQWLLGGCHLVAAILAGGLIDSGRFRSILLTSWALFVVAFTVLQGSDAWAFATGPVYVLGISFYSTALVAFACLGAEQPGRVPRHWRAAWLFGIAGWVGSALGVGMAQDLRHIPDLFLVLTGLVLALAVGLGSGGHWARLLKTHAPTLAGAVAALVVAGIAEPVPGANPEPVSCHGDTDQQIAQGRRIYIREGCIHCHSQYIRPTGDDIERYGPHRPIDRNDRPVLIGNRRQGPDLTWSGRRRDAEWLTRHLQDPRSTSPGSRMPAFAHLFESDDACSDGQALVAYLAAKTGPTAPEPGVAAP